MKKRNDATGHSAGLEPLYIQPLYMPTDGLVASQWYLKNTGQSGGTPGIDINVTIVWDDYTGAGVSVGIFDDAVDFTHSDLNDNYDSSKELVIGGTAWSPQPASLTSSGDTHGTAVAGIIAAENNGVGSVGIAYDAAITGVPVLRSSNAASMLDALAHMGDFDIVNNSWGYTTPFSVDFSAGNDFWESFESSLATAAANGRNGLGTLIVKSAGNSRGAGQETNYDNFTSDRHVIAVGAVDYKGMITNYSTPGASLLIVAPSSNLSVGITTTDLSGTAGTSSGDYRTDFGGTSAAAPMVSGVIALMLEANPDLGWRDVQEILAYSARQVGSTGGTLVGYEKYLWTFNGAGNWNGGGLHFSNDYGFGLVDALGAVRLAESWTAQGTSANELLTSISATVGAAIPDNGSISRTLTLPIDLQIDHITLFVDITHPNRGDLQVKLTSPDGTVSILLDKPLAGTDTGDNLVFQLGSNAFWGEGSAGNWTVTITDAKAGNVGTVNSLTLSAYGDGFTADDVYIFTNEYASLASDPARSLLSDANGGTDTINAAAVTSASTIDLRAGMASSIAGRALTISAGTQIERAYGGDGNDILTGNTAANALYGNRGDDLFTGGAGNDSIDGGAGSDIAQFTGQHSRYTITSENGGYRVADSLVGGDGSDWLVNVEKLQFSDGLYALDGSLISGGGGSGGSATSSDIVGTAGNDILQGSSGNDHMFGMDGSDKLTGGAGADTIDGGAGIDLADFLTSLTGVTVNLSTNANANGDAAGDILIGIENVSGSNLADLLTGDAQANALSGMGGNDILDGGAGNDTLTGGAGDDIFYVDSASDILLENIGEGIDTVMSSVTWTLGSNIENLTLIGTAAINGTGNALANILTGNAAANILNGGSGNDTLLGNAGDDILFGGAGRDDMTGGLGSDRFDFDSAAETLPGAGDRILDFLQGSDHIDLSTIDAKTGTKKNDAFQFIGSSGFSGVAGQLHYQLFDVTGTTNDYTLVQGDTNGDRIADFDIILHGQLTPLQASDFVL